MSWDIIGQLNNPAGSRAIGINKFGRNPVVSTTEEDIWAYGGTETLPSSGVAMFCSCTDNVNGVGQTILVNGLDENWDIQTGFSVLTGQTAAPITDSFGNSLLWTRIHRAYQASSAPDPMGTVYIAESDTLSGGVPTTPSRVHAQILFTNAAQQTEKAMYTVPRGYTGYILGLHSAMLASQGGAARTAQVGIELEDLASDATVGSPSWTPRRRVHTSALSTAAGIATNKEFLIPIKVEELTNIHCRATATANSEIIATFYLLMHPTKKET